MTPPSSLHLPNRIRRIFPYEPRFVTVRGGHRLAYLDEGAGPPVVCLHGNPTWSFFYRKVVRALAPTRRVLVPDHIGCGFSDKPAERDYDYTLAQRVADLEEWVDAIGLRGPATLIVHDWGGMIGMALAHRLPHLFNRFVVMNTAAFRLPPDMRLPWELALIRRRPWGPLVIQGLNGFARTATLTAAVRGLSPVVRDGFLAPYDSWENRIATRLFVDDIPLGPRDRAWSLVADVERGLGRFADAPMLLAWGMQDFVFTPDFLDEWRDHFPEARVRTYPDAGHYLLEDAGDRVIPEIVRFVTGEAGAESGAGS